jgi:uncharacterized membrane protein
MTTTARHPLVEDYLRRLWTEAGALPVDEARELLADIEEHLSAALPPHASETQVRNVLERLGTPADLVASADDAPGTPAPKPKSFASPSGAIACLVFAELLFILFPLATMLWILGLVMLARATVWTEREKVLGYLALGTGFPVVGVLLALTTGVATSCESWSSSDGSSGTTCGGTNWGAIVAWVLTLGYLVFQAFTAWRLLRSARRP